MARQITTEPHDHEEMTPKHRGPVAHLHVHSEYSLPDGAYRVEALAARAAALDQPALGLTDHGVMNGSVELFRACRKHSIKPVPGCEVYVVDDRLAQDPNATEPYHLTLLAQTSEGYRNLMRLSSAGFTEGLHRGRPTVDFDLISRHAEGIVALTGCRASRLCRRIIEDRTDAARAHADDLVQAFGPEDVYFEVQKNDVAEQDKANAGVVRLAREMGRPLIATADVHYLGREGYRHHTVLQCAQTQFPSAAPKTQFDANEFFMKSNAEMAAAFAEWPESLESTIEVAERCDVELELRRRVLPRFSTPGGISEDAHLRALVGLGLRQRYGDPPPTPTLARMHEELSVIEAAGVAGYFLIVADLVGYAKSVGMTVGPGRGATAGSLVAYCLGITEVDPLRHDLLFERFFNRERTALPDIDIDFPVHGRAQLIRYVEKKYGEEAVAQVITFTRATARTAVREAASVLGHPSATGERLASLIPDPVVVFPPSIERCLVPGKGLAKMVAASPPARQIIEVAKGIEGTVRSASAHASALVVAEGALTDVVPVQLVDAGDVGYDDAAYRKVTQFPVRTLEELGLLTLDFIGVRYLDVIRDASAMIERSTGVGLELDHLPDDDRKTFEMLSAGDSVGVFVFDSAEMRDALHSLRPSDVGDLAALLALCRPGAEEHLPTYVNGRAAPGQVTYLDERLRPILESTYGLILYQEQAMRIARELAGFSGARADDLRRETGKKNRAAMTILEREFVGGCAESGTSPEAAQSVWHALVKASDWSFNRAHAVAYALMSYRTAWLKAHHAPEYMAALLISEIDRPDEVATLIRHVERMEIEVLPPDVNLSDDPFTVAGGQIRVGLGAVRGVTRDAARAIARSRAAEGPFTSVSDLVKRVDADVATVAALIESGACRAIS